MNTPRTIVIVGAGLAGANAAFALREEGFQGSITLVGAEPHVPYERPPLSKAYLAGKKPIEKFRVRRADAYVDSGIELALGRSAVSIDPVERSVVLDDGTALAFDRLLLATGSTARRLDVPGGDLAGVYTLRTLDDADAISRAAASAERVAVIGGGWIGSEVAATLRELGRDVTLVTSRALPLETVLGTEVATIFANLHREHGVHLVTGRVTGISGAGRAEGVRLADGRTIAADLIVVGVGAVPDLRLAESAGLMTALGGVATDAYLRSSDRGIFAAGDIAAAVHPVYGRRLRVEHWDNAVRQGKLAAQNMLGGAVAYDRPPYFYTDQFDLGMEFRGLVEDPDDVVISGDTAARRLCAFWLRDGHVSAAMNVNDWDAGDRLEAMVLGNVAVDRDSLRKDGADAAAWRAA